MLSAAECEFVSGGTGEKKITFWDVDRDGVLSAGDKVIGVAMDGVEWTPDAFGNFQPPNGETYADSGEANWYASFGLSALIGISVEFGGDGLLPDWGDVSFAAGVGSYLDFGLASNEETARDQARGGDDYMVIGRTWGGGFEGDLGGENQFIGYSTGIGFMVTDDQDAD
jgi:hypothetical protein